MFEFGFAPFWHIFGVVCPCHAGAPHSVGIAYITDITDSGETEAVSLGGHDGRTRDTGVVGFGGCRPGRGQDRGRGGFCGICKFKHIIIVKSLYSLIPQDT